jgi:sugar phosphate isomerase/epimerase
MSLPIAVQLYSLREQAEKDYASVIRSVAEIGYAGVEPARFPGTTAEKAAELFRKYGLQVPSAHLDLPLGNVKNEVLDAMKAIGCKLLISGKGEADFKTPDLLKSTCDLFNEANAVCKTNGLRFGIHNHWWEYLKLGDRYVYELMLDRLDPSIEFQLDTYWIRTAGVDPAAVIRTMGKRATTLHIKDGPCVKGEPMTAVGAGVMKFAPIIEAGKGSTEWLIVEIDRCATDMLEAVTESFRYLVRERFGRGKS